ncbi:hypothetical protein AB4851_07115 [Burkholderia sp. 22PA0099]|uniref:hypothetical protein n=1 Tax=Burkholderia sp. 22PA0099 TaxID=3237372 RepID=UPI0039C41241
MIKKHIASTLFLIASGSTYAQTTCADIHGTPIHPPLNIQSGTICFVQEALSDTKTGAPIGADSIALYYIALGGAPTKATGRGMLYDDTPGQIVDAFSMKTGDEKIERIFVIHAFEVRASLAEPNSSGKFYSVDVFYLNHTTLTRDDRASNWFGSDYSYLSDRAQITYEFPFQSRGDVQRAIASPLSVLMDHSGNVPVTVKYKARLFDGPDIKSKTRKYLIAGDQATVGDVTAGWCQVNYVGGAKPLTMWMPCSALNPGIQPTDQRITRSGH